MNDLEAQIKDLTERVEQLEEATKKPEFVPEIPRVDGCQACGQKGYFTCVHTSPITLDGGKGQGGLTASTFSSDRFVR